MKQIVVVSGKGGTGKTIVTASFIALAHNRVAADCDVDAANLHLLLNPEIRECEEFKGAKKASIDSELCTRCGECVKICRFNAITPGFAVEPLACEGCGFCVRVCPSHAAALQIERSGEVYISQTRYGSFVHAKLDIGAENSGKLVSQVKTVAVNIADQLKSEYLLVDGPPGVGCSLIAAIAGADEVIAVTEPSLPGIHDLQRVLEVVNHFRIRARIVVNKYDLNPDLAIEIIKWGFMHDIETLGRISFSRRVNEAIVQGVPPVEIKDNRFRHEVTAIWEKISA